MEPQQRRHLVGADAQHNGVAHLAGDVAQGAGLGGAARRVGLGVEVHEHVPALQRSQIDGGPVVVEQAERGGGITGGEHGGTVPKAIPGHPSRPPLRVEQMTKT